MADTRRLQLYALGPISASVTGGESPAPLTQPKVLALLAYLVIARPRGHHSRDTLVALLWPEADEASGRQGLRNALHRLRSMAGDRVIISRGESFVGVDPECVDCDVIEFERAIDERRWDDALNGYGGELLHGFHAAGAPEFEHWLDGERRRLTGLSVQAAQAASEGRQRAGDLDGAIAAARHACVLEPDNERSFRRYLELLIANDDRPTALRAYEEFARRVADEFGAEPAPETRAILNNKPQARRDSGLELPKLQKESADASAPPITSNDRVGMRSLMPAIVALGALAAAASGALLFAPARRATPVPAEALGAELPARWRSDSILLDRYLRGTALLVGRQYAAARDSLLRLTRDAPRYAPAWAGLARAHYRSAFEDVPPRDALPRAAAAARRALALDSTLAVAHEALIAQALWGEWDLDSARRLLDRALVMHPEDSELQNLLATWHRWRGEFDASLEIKSRNAANDPLSPRAAYQITPSLYFAHRCEEAVAPYRRLPQEFKQLVGDHMLYRSLVCAGRVEEAVEVLRDQVLRDGDSTLAGLLRRGMSPSERASVTDRVFRKRLAGEFERRHRDWRPPERIMVSYADRRHADSTLIWLDSMLVERSMMLYVVPFDPMMDFLRNDPRFETFLRRLPWLPALADGPRRLIDSLRVRSSR